MKMIMMIYPKFGLALFCPVSENWKNKKEKKKEKQRKKIKTSCYYVWTA